MKRIAPRIVILAIATIATIVSSVWVLAQSPAEATVDGFRFVEVSSVSDAMEQLYGQPAYMSHEMRPL